MKHLKKFNENEQLQFEDLVLLFAELSDANLSTYRKSGVNAGEQLTHTRQIVITIGEYFRSSPYLIKNLIEPSSEEDVKGREDVLRNLSSNKPFEINIQIDTNNKLDDMINVLEFIRSNQDQVEHFGYKFSDFYLAKERSFQEWSTNLLTVKYISKK